MLLIIKEGVHHWKCLSRNRLLSECTDPKLLSVATQIPERNYNQSEYLPFKWTKSSNAGSAHLCNILEFVFLSWTLIRTPASLINILSISHLLKHTLHLRPDIQLMRPCASRLCMQVPVNLCKIVWLHKISINLGQFGRLAFLNPL
jgi:hypothetical protein